ncbi:MAG: LPS-assembly protein LptD [Syntrophobacteria bacterium]
MRGLVRHIGHCLVLALLLNSGFPGSARGGAESLFAPSDTASVWHLKADRCTHSEREDVYTASGNVHLWSQDRSIKADRMRLDSAAGHAILEGRVRIAQGNDWLEGERAVLDLEKQCGTIEQGRGFLAENHFYFSGELIEKLGPQSYHLEKASFTTCDGEPPSWHFRARDLKVTVDGYSFASHTRFHAGPLPLLYVPYLVFPAKKTRQSGFLPPRLGRSELLGYDVDLPFYWAMDESADATFYAHYMDKRGLMPGVEFRYATGEKSKGILRFDYLSDQEEAESLRRENLREVSPGFSGEYQNRWWWRSKQDFLLPREVQGKLDLDFVSDRDYLLEFETGFSSFDESNRVFEKTFGRDLLTDESSTIRESTLQLNKNWAAHSIHADFHYFDNLNEAQDEFTLQQLPLIHYSAARQPLLGGPLFYQADASYGNYWRREGTHGHRLDLHPRLAWPLRLGPYLELEPSIGGRETVYMTEDFDEPEDTRVEEKTFQSRELFDGRLEASTELSRVFDMGSGGWTKTEHAVRPEIVYEYIPPVNQEQFPLFDEATDRIGSRSRIGYSLMNFFTARLEGEAGEVSYQDFGRLKFSQFYDLTEPEGEGEVGTSLRRPLSNVTIELDIMPKRYFQLTYQSEWSPYDGDFKRHELLARARDQRGDSMKIDYRENREEDGRTTLSEIDGRLNLRLWDGASFGVRSNYSFEQDQNLETEYVFHLSRQCWGVSLSYTDEPNDRRLMVGFTLYGVGELQPQTLVSRD